MNTNFFTFFEGLNIPIGGYSHMELQIFCHDDSNNIKYTIKYEFDFLNVFPIHTIVDLTNNVVSLTKKTFSIPFRHNICRKNLSYCICEIHHRFSSSANRSCHSTLNTYFDVGYDVGGILVSFPKKYFRRSKVPHLDA